MKSYQDILLTVNSFHELGQTALAGEFLVQEYGLTHENFKGFELREIAKPDFILMTTEGVLAKNKL